MVFEAPITVRATSTGAGSTLAGIGRLVAAAQVHFFWKYRLVNVSKVKCECLDLMLGAALTVRVRHLISP